MNSEKLDCLIFLPTLGNGGTERVAAILANYFSDKMKVGLITYLSARCDRFELNNKVVRLVIGEMSDSSSAYGALQTNYVRIRKLRKVLLTHKPAIVLSFLPQCNVVSLIAAIGTDIKTVVSERNNIEQQRLTKPWRILRRIAYRWAWLVTANSTEIKEQLIRDTKCNVTIMPNPISVPRHFSSPGFDHKILLSVGRLVHQKGYDLLIQGFAKSRAYTNGWKLYIAGEGPQLTAMVQLTKSLGIDEQVIWLGFVENPAYWYERASLYVTTSRFEGTSNSVLEAMARARPVMMSETSGGGVDLVDDGINGFIVKLDPTSIADKIDWITENEQTSMAVGLAGRQTVEVFDVEHVGRRWLDLTQENVC